MCSSDRLGDRDDRAFVRRITESVRTTKSRIVVRIRRGAGRGRHRNRRGGGCCPHAEKSDETSTRPVQTLVSFGSFLPWCARYRRLSAPTRVSPDSDRRTSQKTLCPPAGAAIRTSRKARPRTVGRSSVSRTTTTTTNGRDNDLRGRVRRTRGERVRHAAAANSTSYDVTT